MKKLYYGAYEYIETKELPKNTRYKKLVDECGKRGYLMTHTDDGTLAIYYEGVLYKRGKKYREYESVGRKLHDIRGD